MKQKYINIYNELGILPNQILICTLDLETVEMKGEHYVHMITLFDGKDTIIFDLQNIKSYKEVERAKPAGRYMKENYS